MSRAFKGITREQALEDHKSHIYWAETQGLIVEVCEYENEDGTTGWTYSHGDKCCQSDFSDARKAVEAATHFAHERNVGVYLPPELVAAMCEDSD